MPYPLPLGKFLDCETALQLDRTFHGGFQGLPPGVFISKRVLVPWPTLAHMQRPKEKFWRLARDFALYTHP
jgi:hypothetical protein